MPIHLKTVFLLLQIRDFCLKGFFDSALLKRICFLIHFHDPIPYQKPPFPIIKCDTADTVLGGDLVIWHSMKQHGFDCSLFLLLRVSYQMLALSQEVHCFPAVGDKFPQSIVLAHGGWDNTMPYKSGSALYDWLRSTQLPQPFEPLYSETLDRPTIRSLPVERYTLYKFLHMRWSSQCANDSTLTVTGLNEAFYCLSCVPGMCTLLIFCPL